VIFVTLSGLRPEEFEEFFWKESSLMQRFFPRRWGTPYGDIDVLPVNLTRLIVMRPRPHRGQGWCKEGRIFFKNWFSTESIFLYSVRRVFCSAREK
jgi:hypothetical protein